MNIYVGNVQYSTTEDQIRELFEQFGAVESIKMINDRETGRFRGFSFVEMEDEAAQSAIAALNDTDYNGRKIQVNEAKERAERSDRPRRPQTFRRSY
ncbi:MAG: RNA-binding protein [Candidatus Kapabacteria bacterium]|nr:RNA-binding protein [Candidatus Kapabacteria bacterium]